MRYNLTIDFKVLFQKVASDCDLDRSTIQYCLRRLSHEGIKFWTVTLPNVAKSVLFGIENGVYTREISFGSFMTAIQWKGRSLRYFRSLLDRIFCHKTGKLLPQPSPEALLSLRQLTDYCYKLAFAFNDVQKTKAEAKYLANQSFGSSFRCDPEWLNTLRKSAETNYPYLYGAHLHEVLRDYRPRFGPGAFARDPELGYDFLPYYLWKHVSTDLVPSHTSEWNGFSGFFKPYPSARCRTKSYCGKRLSEVLFVPKDSRGPRVISKEPPLQLKAQMSFFSWMTSLLSKNTLGRIQFVDQDINKNLAREASVNRKNASADLENGSDRVWLKVVRAIARNSPVIRFFLQHARSTHFKLPSGYIGVQNSVAGMGSGLTFPLMAFLIHLSVCTYVSRKYRLGYAFVSRHVYVYGDDLIVPSEWFNDAVHALSITGLSINVNKSYVAGPFRESCGGDYLNGVDVTPVRLRLANCGILVSDLGGKALTLRSNMCRDQDAFIVSLSAHRNECFRKGLLSTASYYDELLSSCIPYPVVGVGSPYLGRETDSDDCVFLDNRGVVNQNGELRVVMKGQRVVSFPESCPYKHLASSLLPTQNPYLYEVGTSSGTSFGEVAVPRAVKLKLLRVQVTELLPRKGHKMYLHSFN